MTTNWKRPFFIVWTGQAFSLVGSMLVQFALVWWLTESTGSATVLAMATLVGMLPSIVIGPFAGALVDRWSRRLVMMVADGGIAAATALLAVIYLTGHMQPWHVYVLMFVRAVGGGFHWPAMQASTSLMVPREQLGRVAGMNQTLQGVMSIVTPPVGAMLLAVMPLYAILAIDVTTAILAIGPLFFVSIPQPERDPSEVESALDWRGLVSEVADGLRYIWQWPALMTVLIISTLANLVLNPAFSLLPLVVTQYFGAGALELGWLNSAFGIGMVLGGVILSAWGGFRKRMHTMLLGLAGLAVGVLVVGLAPTRLLWVAIAGMWLAGMASPMSNGPFMALLQGAVKPEMQGRVFTAAGSLSSLASPLGMAVAGPVADVIGAHNWFTLAGVVCLGLALAVVLLPGVLGMDEEHPTVRVARRAAAERGVPGE
jgi:DHA3 family macrolide efflux protein-like MFS transporter